MSPSTNAPDFDTGNQPERARRGDSTALGLARLEGSVGRIEEQIKGVKEKVDQNTQKLDTLGTEMKALVRVETLLGTLDERLKLLEPKVDRTRYWIAGASAIAAVVVIMLQIFVVRLVQQPKAEPPVINVYPNQPAPSGH